MKSVRISVLATAVGLALFGMSVTPDLQAAQSTSRALVATAGAQTLANRYIITFSEPGLVNYKGNLAGLQRTAPESDLVAAHGSPKLDVNSTASIAYKNYLAEKRNTHVSAIEQKLGRGLDVHYTYDVTRNAVSVEMSAAEAAEASKVEGVASVAAVKILHPQTFRGPTFIGANTIWDGSGVPSYDSATRGQGVRVGVIDTGANSAHPSFANDPMCGFSPTHPKLYANDCIDSSSCTGPTPEADDGNGHGVHTSSTAAGNTIDNTVTPAPLLPDGVTMSGVAPCAEVHTYKVCDLVGCYDDAITAAIQNAISDQVDAINFSIGPDCGGSSPWEDNLDFLGAEGADIFVAAAAGNTRSACTDPTGLVSNMGPWLMTVAASTQDQALAPALEVVGPGTPDPILDQIQLNPGSTTVVPDTVALTDVPLRTFPANIEGCTAGTAIPANYFSGTIAVVRRGTCSFTEKITNAANAGATTVIVGNNQAGTINMDTTGVPAGIASFSTLQPEGDALIAFVDANEGIPTDPDVIFANGFDEVVPGATGDYEPGAIFDVQGDVLAAFSMRGPTPDPVADLTKPDITGPGVNIYAAFDAAEGSYGLDSGTSMSSPHLAGSGALVRAVQPNWSPMEIKSALQTTATLTGFQEDGVTPWTVDQVGSGRVDLSKATRAGLTLDETPDNFLAANPDGGTLDQKDLNLASLRNSNCGTGCTWTRTFKNRLNASGTWTLTATNPAGYTVTMNPSSLTLAPGFSGTVTFTATAVGTPGAAMSFGRVDMHEGSDRSPDQHLTVAIGQKPPIINVAPTTLTSTQLTNTTATQSLTVSNAGGGTLTWSYNGSGLVNGALWNQPKNGTNGIVSDYSIAEDGGGFTAADFQVAGTGSSAIRKIKVFGFDNTNTLAAQPKITFSIYADNAGKPAGNPDTGTGSAPVWTFDRAPSDAGVSIAGSGDITLDLVAAGETLSLPAGTYWLSVYPTYTGAIGPAGSARWNWYQAAQQAGPGKLTGTEFGLADWTALQGLVGWPDVAFSIEGDVPCGASWLSVSPTSGSDAAGASTTVTATFDSTGLADGNYAATACINSNDAATPLVTVPVTLHVGTPPPPQAVQDPSFELSTGNGDTNPAWDAGDTQTTSGTDFYDATNIPVRSGNWAVWLGGWQGGAETQYFSQSVTFPASGATFLNYWRYIGDTPDAPGMLTVSIDGTPVETTDLSAATPDAGFVQQSIDVSSYANGAAHVIRFEFGYADADGNGVDGDTFIDDVTLDPTNVSSMGANPHSVPFSGAHKVRR